MRSLTPSYHWPELYDAITLFATIRVICWLDSTIVTSPPHRHYAVPSTSYTGQMSPRDQLDNEDKPAFPESRHGAVHLDALPA